MRSEYDRYHLSLIPRVKSPAVDWVLQIIKSDKSYLAVILKRVKKLLITLVYPSKGHLLQKNC